MDHDVESAIVSMVESALAEDPSLTSQDLKARAAEMYPEVGDMTGRQFHARYALQVRRRLRRAASEDAFIGAQDPVKKMLRKHFEDRCAALLAELEEAFARSIAADSLANVDEVISAVDHQIEAFQKVSAR